MSWMDGTSRKVLAAKGVNGNASIYWPVSLSYSRETKTLYWLDVLSQTIESITIVEPIIRISRKVGALYSQSMAVADSKIYWTDNSKDIIQVASVDSMDFKRDMKVYNRSPEKKSFLKSVDQSRYLDYVEPKEQMSCPGVWFPLPSTGVCLCGDGYSKNALGSACLKSPTPTTIRDRTECKLEEFNCKSLDECINRKFICDGTPDCSDASDEQLQPDGGPCPVQCFFKCDGLRCLEKHQVCNLESDCIDETDESIAQCHNSTELDDYTFSYDYCDEFLCDNGNCVPAEQRCDSVDNCGDGSDETFCAILGGTTEKIFDPKVDEPDDPDPESELDDHIVDLSECKSPDYYCVKNRKCISMWKICDGISDCSDSSDELGSCSEKMCDHITDCQFFCHNAPNTGFICYCPQHMTLEADGRICSAPQACDEFSTCSHFCEKLNPLKVKCKCYQGYQLKEDNFTCESTFKEDPVLLFSNRHILRGIKLNKKHTEIRSYYSMAKNIIGLDFYYDQISHEYEVMWTDITKDQILSGKFHNDELLNVKAIVESDLSTTEAVAVDWIGKNLYWIDSTLKHIEVSTKEGLHRATLISENIVKPRSMAIDSRFGYLFWSDWEEEEPRIERSTLAGEERSTIFFLKQIGGAWPNGITLDYAKKRVFFLDARSKEIHTVDYNGANHKRILKNFDYLHHPFAITIYENNVYWTDWRLGSVVKADKFTGKNVSIFYQSSTQPFDIKVMHPSRQPWDYGDGQMIISPCDNANCSHLCLLSTHGSFKCACPHMMRLNEDNKVICEKVDEILFYITNKPEIRAVELKHPMSNAISTIYHTQLILAPNHIAIHPIDSRIFWADLQLKEIKSVKLSTAVLTTSQKIETILDSAVHDVEALAIEYRSNLMYIAQSISEEDESERIMASSEGGHRLLVGNLHGEYLSVLMDNINVISSLIIVPQERKIYYSITEQKEDGIRYIIYQCSLDGSKKVPLIFEDEVVESLTFDGSSRRLYFLKNNRKIFYFDLKLQKTELVNTYYGANGTDDDKFTDLFISSIEVYKESIYFGENTTSTVRFCKKELCRVPEIYRNNTQNIRQLKILALSDYTLNAEDSSGCFQNNGNCDHLCIPLEGSNLVCKCSIGYSIDPIDYKKCIGSDDIIIYSLGYELKGVLINSTEINALAPLQRVNVISSVDFDVHNDYIYVSDSERGEITRIKRDGSSRQTVISTYDIFEQSMNDWLGDIAVDWVAENLYWTDKKRGLIEVSRLDGSFRRVISSQIFKPSIIAVDPILGIIFYVDGENKIIRCDLDGGNSLIISKMSSNVISDLTLDRNNQLIYVCEMRKNW